MPWDSLWRNRRPWSPPLAHYGRRIRADLDLSGAVTLNSSGAGFVYLAPDGGSEWRVTQGIVTTTTGPTDSSAAFLYRSAVFPHRLVAQTSQGGGDVMDFAVTLRPGDTLICLWSGGNSGDIATLNISGSVRVMAMG